MTRKQANRQAERFVHVSLGGPARDEMKQEPNPPLAPANS